MAAYGLASTTYSSGADDTFATVDAYTKNISSSVVNSITKLDVKLPDYSSITNLNKKDIPGLLEKAKEKVTVGPTDIVKRLFPDGSGAQSNFRNLSDKIKQGFDFGKDASSTLKVTVGGATQAISAATASMNAVRDLSNIIKTYTCGVYSAVISDQKANSAMIAGLMKAANKFSMKGVFDKLADPLSCNTPSPAVMSGALSSIIPSLAATNKLSGIIEIGKSKYGDTVKGIYPDITPVMLTGFSKKADAEAGEPCKAKDYSALYTDTSQAFNNIDPSWNANTFNGNTVLDTSNFIKPNADFHDLIKANSIESTKPIQIQTDINNIIMPTYDSNVHFNMLAIGQTKVDAGALLTSAFPINLQNKALTTFA